MGFFGAFGRKKKEDLPAGEFPKGENLGSRPHEEFKSTFPDFNTSAENGSSRDIELVISRLELIERKIDDIERKVDFIEKVARENQ